MAEQVKKEIANWLDISGAMLRTLLPRAAGLDVFGHGLPPAEFAALVGRESARVDHALTALATAADEAEVKALFRQLSPDTVTVLFSRWAKYTEAWRALLSEPNPKHLVPPRDCWRAVFLAMTGEGFHSSAAARQLWPEQF